MNIRRSILLVTALFAGASLFSQTRDFKVIAFYSESVDPEHVVFANTAVDFFAGLSSWNSFTFESTTDMRHMNYAKLHQYDVVMMFNDLTFTPAQQEAFQKYMENGGGWYGMHIAALVKDGKWDWFTHFLGGCILSRYSWPPLPAKLSVEDPLHPVCKGLPGQFVSPVNEWYQWGPAPGDNPQVDVLVSLAPDEFPHGIKNEITEGDVPVVWTHTKYRMIYLNMGHGKNIFSDATQNHLFVNALQWLVRKEVPVEERVSVAYVTSWETGIPDPSLLTHINYAFGHVNETFNGITVDNPERFQSIVGLKSLKPELKVSLSIGGWGSGRFSEMAAIPENRKAFAADCRRVVEEYRLDGIDIDWEYPTNRGPGISSAPEDTRNFTLLMKDIRQAIGPGRLLTLASAASGKFIDFKSLNGVVDFVNIMTYDMSVPPFHHSGLYPSSMTGPLSCYEAVLAHIRAGFPRNKLVLGIPFYGKPGKDFPKGANDYGQLIQLADYEQKWDDIAKAPYLTGPGGEIVCTYDDPRSIGYKCRFILKYGLRGAMFWDYNGDDEQGSLRKAIYDGILLP